MAAPRLNRQHQAASVPIFSVQWQTIDFYRETHSSGGAGEAFVGRYVKCADTIRLAL
jgi:hypothetical protein